MESIIKELSADNLKVVLSYYHSLPSYITELINKNRGEFIYSGRIKPTEFNVYTHKSRASRNPLENMPVVDKPGLEHFTNKLSEISDKDSIHEIIYIFINKVHEYYQLNKILNLEIIHSQSDKLVQSIIREIIKQLNKPTDLTIVSQLIHSLAFLLGFTPKFIVDHFTRNAIVPMEELLESLGGKLPYVDYSLPITVMHDNADIIDNPFMRKINGRILFNNKGNIDENVLSNLYQLDDSYFSHLECETATFSISEKSKIAAMMNTNIESITSCLTGQGREFIIVEYGNSEYVLSEIDRHLYAIELASIDEDEINAIKIHDDTNYELKLECNI